MATTHLSPVQVTVHLSPDDLRAALQADVLAGLSGEPKALSPKWLYDEKGCALFDQITELPEYYPTRAERQILMTRGDDIAELAGADTLVELGSGTSEKTRLILDALADKGTLRRFAPFDVAEPTLREAAAGIVAAYPGVTVEAVVGDFEQHLGYLPTGGRRLIAFLGGTIGNLAPPARAVLLADVVEGMAPGDSFLVGTDLVKDRDRLVAAYDDAAGVTAAFNRNVLSVLNTELGAHFVPDRFDHVACFDEEEQWIEMRLRSVGTQLVPVESLGMEVGLADGEEIRTEISAKFTTAGICGELETAGLDVRAFWTDEAGDFGLTLATR